jgi:hypothetical protein
MKAYFNKIKQISWRSLTSFGMTVSFMVVWEEGSREREVPALCYPPPLIKKVPVIPNDTAKREK